MPRKGEGQNAPTILAEMRHVYRKPKGKDRTEGHRRWRELMEGDFREFMRVMERHELAFRKESREAKAREVERVAGGGSGAVVVDREHLRCEDLVGQLIGEFTSGMGGEEADHGRGEGNGQADDGGAPADVEGGVRG